VFRLLKLSERFFKKGAIKLTCSLACMTGNTSPTARFPVQFTNTAMETAAKK